ncbi:MAG: hypothetical protein CMQ23_07285 [Gammaproteobacteria bacterium]|nr:hypothetical protein [Gammaproteobacteria bacterium]|tara:strand:+ start:4151 stop:4456 length:306 start_codon:yes stop_codon:yes gene_type:complete
MDLSFSCLIAMLGPVGGEIWTLRSRSRNASEKIFSQSLFFKVTGEKLSSCGHQQRVFLQTQYGIFDWIQDLTPYEDCALFIANEIQCSKQFSSKYAATAYF